jgi:hypothetical protein
MEWNAYQSILLGHVLGPNLGFAPLVKSEDDSTDLPALVDMLNTGDVSVEGDFCIGFCSDAKSYYLLYKSGLLDTALDLLAKECAESNMSHSLFPPSTERSLSRRSNASATSNSNGPTKFELQSELEAAEERIRKLTEELEATKATLHQESQRRAVLESTLNQGINRLSSKFQTKNISSLPVLAWGRQSTAEAVAMEPQFMFDIDESKEWSMQGAIPLGILPPDSHIWSEATAFDPEEVDSLRVAISMLNSGELECETDFAIVYSQTAFCHYLVFPSGFEQRAQSLINREFARLTSTYSGRL